MPEAMIWFGVITAYILSTYSIFKVGVLNLELKILKENSERQSKLLDKLIRSYI